MSVQAQPAAVPRLAVEAALIPTTTLNSRLPSSYVSSLFNVQSKAAAVVVGPVVAVDLLVAVDFQAVVVDDPVAAVVADPVAVAAGDKLEIHSTD